MRTIIVIACHFKGPWALCETTLVRLRVALKLVEKGDRILVTGPVSYHENGPTLGKLMRSYLISKRFPSNRIDVLAEGVGTFSEARATCKYLRGHEAIVISSSWYLFQARPIWGRRARESHVLISFRAVEDTGGWRTVLLYSILGVIIRGVIAFGLERVLEERLTCSQKSRTQGFTFDGCR